MQTVTHVHASKLGVSKWKWMKIFYFSNVFFLIITTNIKYGIKLSKNDKK